MYTFELATTGTISFSDFLITTDLHSQVSATTQLRSRVRAVLKENRAGTSTTTSAANEVGKGKSDDLTDSGASANDWMLIVKTLEEYLPHLLAVFNCVQTDDLILRYEPVFSWRTSISISRFRGPQRVDLPGLYYELASTLLTYALTLSNFAGATVASLGSYERNRTLSADDRKAKDDKLRSAADTLCRASGILLYLAQELLPKWRDHAGRLDGLPPDLTVEATLALSKVCLAEAQALAIRKLVSPSVALAVDTVTPGPPLEKGHPSASLLAKLHLNVVEGLESATGLLRTVGEKSKVKGGGGKKVREGLSANHEHELSRRMSATKDDVVDDDGGDAAGGGGGGGGGKMKLFGKLRFGKSDKHNAASGSPEGSHSAGAPPPPPPSSGSGVGTDLDISSSLLKYLAFSTTFHRSMAYKWLGIDAGESSNNIGTAIAFLTLSSTLLSSSTLKDLTSTLSNISISSSSSKTKKRGGAVEEELHTITHWLTSYRKLNDTVSFQPVPSAAEVQNKVPAGRAALLVKQYNLPEPSFGPGSSGYVGKGGAGLAREEVALLDEDHPARRNLVGMQGGGGEGGSAQTGGYAGQGAYF